MTLTHHLADHWINHHDWWQKSGLTLRLPIANGVLLMQVLICSVVGSAKCRNWSLSWSLHPFSERHRVVKVVVKVGLVDADASSAQSTAAHALYASVTIRMPCV